MKNKSELLDNTIFYFAYFFFMLYAFFGTIDIFSDSLKTLTNISIFLVGASFVLKIKNYNFKELIIIFSLILLSFIYIDKTENFVLLKLILIIIVSKNISFEKRILFDIRLRIIFLVLMLILFNLGIANDYQVLYNGQIRHSLGFSNPNVLGMHILILCLDFLYINRNKLSFLKILSYLSILFISNYYSGSRTAVVVVVFAITLFVLFKHKKNFFECKAVKFFIVNSPIILSIILYFAYYLFLNNNEIGIFIDKILSGRLSNIDFFAKNFTINLFGSDIASANKSLDTAIAYVLYAFGISGCILYIFSFKKLLKKLYKVKNYPLLIIIFIFVVYGLSEKLWLFADCNLLITTLSLIIFRENDKYNTYSLKIEDGEKKYE